VVLVGDKPAEGPVGSPLVDVPFDEFGLLALLPDAELSVPPSIKTCGKTVSEAWHDFGSPTKRGFPTVQALSAATFAASAAFSSP
jgi:hypothetical protein